MAKNQINMTDGSVVKKLLQFSIPLIFSSILQLLFNAADLVVVGKFAGEESLAAVGSTSSLINLIINLFIGLSVGTNVIAAHYFGSNDKKNVSQTVHTAILISIYSGIILTLFGVSCSKYLLQLMDAPNEVLSLATLYLKIYFGGITSTMIYNFGSALLRAKGDTQRPLYILFIAGIINLILNLFFVIVLKMNVDGVALATVISQTISAICVIVLLIKESDEFHLNLKKIKINTKILFQIVKIGVPAGFQGIMFSFSNVIIQSSVNSFGTILISGNSAVCNIEGFVYTAMNGFSQGSLTFCSQNLGAKKFDRIKKVAFSSQIIVLIIGLILGFFCYFFGESLIGIYSKNPEVIKAGMIRCKVIFLTYFLCGLMDTMANTIRGIGHSLTPVITSLLGACGLRILYLFTIFKIPKFHLPITIFLSYPISWIVTYIVNLICFFILFNKTKKKLFSIT